MTRVGAYPQAREEKAIGVERNRPKCPKDT